MTLALVESDAFLQDLEHQFEWYIHESKLDSPDAIELANKFRVAVSDTLKTLVRQPEMGRRRFPLRAELKGTRSWRVNPPFDRFLIYYYVENEMLLADRLIEGHRQITTDQN
jgi:plasmid stabilization system protein ParE